jgi:hypothetical protein
MEIKESSGQCDPPLASRKVYTTPKLKVLGPVGALTQAGTSGSVEPVMGMSMSGMQRS